MQSTSSYVSIEQISDQSVRPPEVLDFIEFEFDGIVFKVRGVLHGLTGGANREYIDLVNRSISSATGFVMTEKSMKTLYKGRIDKELDDWMPFRPRDAFRLGLRLYYLPSLLWMLVTEGFRERLTKKDRFETSGRTDWEQLGGSPLFHRLDPEFRRAMSGFPDSIRGIKRHLALRCGNPADENDKAVVPGRHWRFLNKIERFSIIPLRSVHMLAYARTYAKSRGIPEVSLFVGETHNTDMQAIARHWKEFEDLSKSAEKDAFWSIVDAADRAASKGASRTIQFARYLRYIGALTAPLAIPALALMAGAITLGSS